MSTTRGIARVTDFPETLVFDHKLAADRADPAWLNRAPRLGELDVPVQVIRGADDPIFPPPTGLFTAGAIPHATLLTVDGMGHMLEPAFYAPLTEALSAPVVRDPGKVTAIVAKDDAGDARRVAAGRQMSAL